MVVGRGSWVVGRGYRVVGVGWVRGPGAHDFLPTIHDPQQSVKLGGSTAQKI